MKKSLALIGTFAFALVAFLIAGSISSSAQAYTPPASNHADFNFNYDWLFLKSNPANNAAAAVSYSETAFTPVSLPHTWSDDIFNGWIGSWASDGSYRNVAWYRKHFTLPTTYSGRQIILEFQGISYLASFYVNGTLVSQNGSGFGPSGVDITNYVTFGSDNVIAVSVDNQTLDTAYGYTEGLPAGMPFNVNMGGINRDVTLHITDKAHLTKPLYRNLGTQGTYIYPTNINTLTKACTLNVQAEVKNDYTTSETISCTSTVVDETGTVVATIPEGSQTIAAGQTFVFTGTAGMTGIHFWDPTYPYLYQVYTQLTLNSQIVDVDEVTTGIRTYVFNPNFGFEINGHYVYLNGYAPRASMEWPAVGTPVDWMNDYDFSQMKVTNGNFVRPMQCAPCLEQVQAADRYGIIMVVPSAYTEDDQTDAVKWQEDLDIMRDNTIYFRNDPSVEFYEACNGEPSAQHMTDMLNVRLQWDPSGGRLAGARTNDSDTTQGIREYSGTMDSNGDQATTPLFDCEYGRTEGPRRVWDENSPIFNPDWNGSNTSITPVNGVDASNPNAKYITGGYFNVGSTSFLGWGFYGLNEMVAFNSTVTSAYGQGNFIGEYLTPIPESGGTFVGAYYRTNSSEESLLENTAKYYGRLEKSYAYQSQATSATAGVNVGGAKIIWSDSYTDGRMTDMEVARTSGVVDGVRLPKEVYYGMQVAQADPVANPEVYIAGHWNYPAGTVKTVYVVANTPQVTLKTYNTSGGLIQDYTSVGTKNFFPSSILSTGSDMVNNFVFAFPSVAWQAGSIVAQGENAAGTAVGSPYTLTTTGNPASIKITPGSGPSGWMADGSDVSWFDVEVVDSNGNRCPTYSDFLTFSCSGNGTFLGGYNSGRLNSTNLSHATSGYQLQTENGINRVFVRSTRTAGSFTLTVNGVNNVTGGNFTTANSSITSTAVVDTAGLSTVWPQKTGANLSALTEPTPVAEGQAPPLVTQVPVAPATNVTGFQYTGGKTGASVIEDVQAGQQVYVDESYTLPTLPSYLQGAEFIQPFESDAGDSAATDQYGFNMSKFSYIYVVIDAANDMPNSDQNSSYQWQLMPDTLTINGRAMNIFRSRLMQPNENALLADNAYENAERFSSSSNMYLVFVQNVEQQLVQPTDTITASTTQGNNVAADAIDGNVNTHWNASDGTFPQTITLDLGQEMAIGGYTMNIPDNTVRYAQYMVDLSDDSVNWNHSLDMTQNQLTGVNEFLVPSTGAFVGRYVRITFDNVTGGGWGAITELQIYGVPASMLSTNSGLLSSGASVSATSSATNQGPTFAVDGVTTTYWQASSTSYPQTFTINLGQAEAITNVNTTWLSGSGQAYKYKIGVSANGSSYTTVVDQSSNTMVGQTNDNFNALGQYVQITISGSSVAGVAAGAYEIDVSGEDVQLPLITSPLVVSTGATIPFTYDTVANYGATSYSATGLPAGLSISGSTGVITGTPTVSEVGTYTVTLSATNSAGTYSNTLDLTVTPAPIPPVINSPTTASATVGTTYSSLYQITTSTLNATSYAATGLPTGLTLNTTTGVISGTVIATGTSTVTLTATNGSYGTSSPVTLTLTEVAGTDVNLALNQTVASSGTHSQTANLAPAAVDGNTSTGWESVYTDAQWIYVKMPQVETIHNVVIDWQNATGKNYQLQGSSDGNTWVDIATPIVGNKATGVVAAPGLHASYQYVRMNGTLRATGYGYFIYELQVYGVTGSSGNQPVVDTTTALAGTVASTYSYQLPVLNSPTSYSVTNLPPGLTYSSSTGVISGTPTTPGTTTMTVTATNSTGTCPATAVSILINPTVPTITSSLTASGMLSTAFKYTIQASNGPITNFIASPLPNGLSLDSSSGAITGTPTAVGTTNVTLSATNATGTGPTAVLVITVTPNTPVITSLLAETGKVNAAFVNYDITATNSPTSYSASPIPPGLTFNSTTGVISGTPTTAGTTNVTISATNANGAGSPATLVITIDPLVPVVNSPSTATGTVGSSFTYNVTASSSPTSYGETGALPPGLTFSSSSGAITGTPTTVGTTSITVNATNVSGTSGNFTVTITINPAAAAPSMISPTTAWGTVGSAMTYVGSATNTPTSYTQTSGTLPNGLTFSTTTGAITGTPTTAGSSTIGITATNGTGTSSALSLTITIYASGVIPTITSPTTATAAVGSVFTYQTTGSDGPTSYAETGTLPTGLTFSSTGTITGTPTAAGTSSLNLTATNSHGTSSTVTLTLTVNATTTDTNVGLNQVAYGSSFQAGNGYASANDGSTTTRWAAADGTVPQYWEVDLGSNKTLSRVDINWYSNTNRYSQYTILTSTDNATWTTRVNKTSNVTDGLTSDTFSSTVSARYVIVNMSKVSSGFASAYEIGVYGH
jgi:hypothetical protein